MDFLLKQRLIGAIVLVALGVIFIPLLLEGPNKELVPEMEPLPALTEPFAGVELSRFPDAGEVPAEASMAVVQTNTPPPETQVKADPAPIPIPIPTGGTVG